MYPQLFNQASRLAPMLSRVLSRGGSFASPFWKASQIEAPEVTAKPVPPRDPRMPSVPISQDNLNTPSNYSASPASPAAPPVLPPWMQGAQWMNPGGSPTTPAASQGAPPPQSASVPMPQARPAEAPQPTPDTSFLMRNALMQQDPMGGGFIDPTGAASVTGPDLISKMMTYLHNKA